MAGNQPDTAGAPNARPRPDRGPPGGAHGSDNTSGYDEKKPTSYSDRSDPDPTAEGNRPAQSGVRGATDPNAPAIDHPVPPGDVPSKTPVKEPERGEAQYVDRDTAQGAQGTQDAQAIYSDAARPVVPGPADGAD
jgi:hypothetical protein